jgi:hypothetical protein
VDEDLGTGVAAVGRIVAGVPVAEALTGVAVAGLSTNRQLPTASDEGRVSAAWAGEETEADRTTRAAAKPGSTA